MSESSTTKLRLGQRSDLHHRLIALPDGKKGQDIVAERHDIVLLLDASKSNPNGDPDTGNMPRMQPDTLKGLVTDVCLKRKVRNFFSLFGPQGELLSERKWADGYGILIHEDAVIQNLLERAPVPDLAKRIFTEEHKQSAKEWVGVKTKANGNTAKTAGENDGDEAPDSAPEVAKDGDDGKKAKQPKKKGPTEFEYRSWRDALCQTFFDVRAFGGVVATEGPLKGSFYGQIRGPIQFSFGESLDKVLQLDFSITRCAVASEKEKSGAGDGGDESGANRTMGRMHKVDYGLYRAHIFLSPAFAMRTGFTYYDLDNFLFAVQNMYNPVADATHARPGGMRVVGLVDFQHTSALGNEHAHKLFDLVCVKKKDTTLEYPRSLDDYHGKAPLCGAKVGRTEQVTARRLVWDVPEMVAENGEPDTGK